MDSKKIINICLACDERYAPFAGVSIASFLKNSKNDEFLNFYILSNKISIKNKEKINALRKIKECNIEFREVEKSKFNGFYLPSKKAYISISAYYRFLIAEMFSDLDKILYVDCDVIATDSIWDFYNIDLKDNYAAVIKDTSSEENQARLGFNPNEFYFNSGVILMNLKKWRTNNIVEKLFATVKDGLDDQDILNLVLRGKTIFVDAKWNWQGKAKYYKEKIPPKLIHFITVYKPWITGSKLGFNNEYFKALALTPWNNFYDQHLRRFLPVLYKDRKYIHLCFCGVKTRIRYK